MNNRRTFPLRLISTRAFALIISGLINMINWFEKISVSVVVTSILKMVANFDETVNVITNVSKYKYEGKIQDFHVWSDKK